METLQSHVLHLYFLAAPDFVNVGSVFPLIDSHPDVVKRAAKIKLLANDLCDCVGGRRMHPTRTVIGGFTMLPEKEELLKFKYRLQDVVDDLTRTADLFRQFVVPDFSRETEFVSLKGSGEYPFIGGDLVSTDGVIKKEHEYRLMTNEYMVGQSTSKWSKLSRQSFAVGALARLNNNFEFLHPAAKELSLSFGLKPVNHNPYMNNIAQLVECVHVVMESIDLIDGMLDSEWQEPRQKVVPKEGIGVGAVEVPRGILYHCYEFDKEGRIVRSDCVIPTSQNHANIQHDLMALAEQYAGKERRTGTSNCSRRCSSGPTTPASPARCIDTIRDISNRKNEKMPCTPCAGHLLFARNHYLPINPLRTPSARRPCSPCPSASSSRPHRAGPR